MVVSPSSEEPLEGAGPGVTVERATRRGAHADPVLARLHSRYAVRSVLCEGGPTLFCALLGEGLVDELFLSLAPRDRGRRRGADDRRGLPLAELLELELVWALEAEGELFLVTGSLS